MAYNSFYMSSLSYGGTSATPLTYKECEEIRKPVVNAILLPKMGINRNAPRAVTFTTSNFGGLGLDHLAEFTVRKWKGNVFLDIWSRGRKVFR